MKEEDNNEEEKVFSSAFSLKEVGVGWDSVSVMGPHVGLLQWYSAVSIRLPPDVISLQLSTPNVVGV
jgi:hypothetical protein